MRPDSDEPLRHTGGSGARHDLFLGPDTAPPAGQSFAGQFFSPIEAAIWQCLRDGPMPAKAIARAVSQKYTPSLRTILANLRHRHVLTCTVDGYRRAERKAAGRA